MDAARLHEILIKHQLVESGNTIILGFSGGPDSTALLWLLCECDINITVIPVYIDHGLRPDETGAEKELLYELAAKFNLHCEVVSVDVPGLKATTGMSLEECARILRYEALENCRKAHSADVIAVAHTADDQAEEVLLRLFRGTGLQGLSGMQMKNDLLIRPLLHTPKIALLKYIEKKGITYCTDSSNSDKSILRNRLRLDVLPLIGKHFNPSIQSTLLQTAKILQEDNDLLDSLASKELLRCFVSKKKGENISSAILQLPLFNRNHTAVKRRIIEKIIWKFGVKPSFQQIETICDIAEHGSSGSELHLPLGLRLYKYRDQLCFEQPFGREKYRGRIPSPSFDPLEVKEPAEYEVAELTKTLSLWIVKSPPEKIEDGNLLIDSSKISFPMVLRPAQPGEKFMPQGMEGRKKVSRYLSDRKVAKPDRPLYPVLVCKNDIVAVVGQRIDARFGIDEETENYLLISWNNSSP